VLDADLILAADGEDRTRMALTGCYRPPLGRLGAGLDLAVMRSVAGAIASPAIEGHPAEDTNPRWHLAPEPGMP
jgi:hypothetical protein